MADTPYKILLFMKRKPGMSVEAFRDYYEGSHAPLAETYSQGVARYVRRYLDPQPHPETGAWDEPEYDVITEIWFADEATYKGTLAYITTNIMPDEIVADELNLFDRTAFRIATVVERESKLG